MSSWKNEIKFDSHFIGNNIVTVKNYPIKIKIIGIKNKNECDLSEEDSLRKIMNKDLKIIELSENFCKIDGIYSYAIKFNDFNFEISFNNKLIDIKDLLNEFKNKNSPDNIDVLNKTKLRSGDFFEYGKDTLKSFYFDNEERLKKFKELIVNGQYSLPTKKEDLNELKDFIKKNNEEVKSFLLNNIPSFEERFKINKKIQNK